MSLEAQSIPEQLGGEMNDAQRTPTLQSEPTPAPKVERVIIHHLSDLRYKDDSKQREKLFRYRGYLDTLPKDRQPTVVVVTGDLTESGKQHDLRTVANILAACFPEWEHELHEHIFVLPGVRDVNWESIGGLGWQAFLESFKEFALPFYAQASEHSNRKRRSTGVIADTYVGYPICTCYQPKELSARLKKEIATYGANYTKFTRMRDQLRSRNSILRRLFARTKTSDDEPEQVSVKTRAELDNARTKFLQITEDYQPLALASGRVLKRDLEQFTTWSGTLAASASKNPLKILITHHPLAIDMEHPTQRAQTRPEEHSFKELAQKAAQAGFYLALHGHAHQHADDPKALSGFSILHDAKGSHPLRQIGAASLCDTGAFNEIIAERRPQPATTTSNQPKGLEAPLDHPQNGQPQAGQPQAGQPLNGQPLNAQPQSAPASNGTAQQEQQNSDSPADQVAMGDWRFELRLINVDVKSEAAKPPFLLLNPEESAEQLRERLESAAERRQVFEVRMQTAMGQFSERVHQSSIDKQQDRPNAAYLPQSAMQVIEAIIRDIIFSGCAVRVRILVKDDTDHRPFPKLTAAYLTPPIFEGPDTLVYPASVAAWSLVLGRILRYPDIVNNDPDFKESDFARWHTRKWHTKDEDHEWLRATNKLVPLRLALDALNQELFARSVPNEQMQEQYKNLLASIKQMESGAKDAFILGSDIYQDSPDSGRSHTYPAFICVPYPRRPRGGALPSLPETMALDVGVRSIQTPNTAKDKQEEIFTAERVAMLESIAELIGMMLTTANALGKPRGLWDPRVRG